LPGFTPAASSFTRRCEPTSSVGATETVPSRFWRTGRRMNNGLIRGAVKYGEAFKTEVVRELDAGPFLTIALESTFNPFVREPPPGRARPISCGGISVDAHTTPCKCAASDPWHTSQLPPLHPLHERDHDSGRSSLAWRLAPSRRPLVSGTPKPPARPINSAGGRTWSLARLTWELFARGLHSAQRRDSLAKEAATLTIGPGPVRLNQPPISWLSDQSRQFRCTYEEDNNGSRATRRAGFRAGLDGRAIN